jgi:hypothetical protein
LRPFRKWVVEIEVSDTWVEDGFDLTDERMHRIVAEHLSYAYGSEIRCKVLERPDDAVIAEVQGYKSVEKYLAERR